PVSCQPLSFPPSVKRSIFNAASPQVVTKLVCLSPGLRGGRIRRGSHGYHCRDGSFPCLPAELPIRPLQTVSGRQHIDFRVLTSRQTRERILLYFPLSCRWEY